MKYTPTSASSPSQTITAAYQGTTDEAQSSGTAALDIIIGDLSLGLSAPSTAADSTTFTVELAVTNNGPDGSPRRTMAINLPTGGKVSATQLDGGRRHGHQTSWIVPPLPNGQVYMRTLTLQVSSSATGHATLKGFIAKPRTDPDRTNDSATVKVVLG